MTRFWFGLKVFLVWLIDGLRGGLIKDSLSSFQDLNSVEKI